MAQLAAAPAGSVTLGSSHWQKQYAEAMEVYSGFDDDSLLHGFRLRAGLPAPGRPLTGWCARDSSMVLGQFLSTLAMFGAAQGDDDAIRQKAARLTEGWAQTFGLSGFSDLDHRMSPGGHYAFDKFVGGFTDVGSLLGVDTAYDALRELTTAGERYLDCSNVPASPVPALHSGRAGEWYTLSENLYRAAVATGDDRYRAFGDVWNYDHYWDGFRDTDRPADVWGVHAYSHLNTFGGAITSFGITGDADRLAIARNAYDFFTQTQCYATGGFGPAERIQPYGSLPASLDRRMDGFEAPCGSWAAFKLARELILQTGDGRYGAWIERLFYNGIGAALPTRPDGSHFYYADYRPTGAVKARARDTFCCCAGTYGQAVASYPGLVFFVDDRSVYVNLFTPAQIVHAAGGDEVRVRIETEYPLRPAVRVHVSIPRPMRFRLALRIPTGTGSIGPVRVGGDEVVATTQERGWLIVDREWTAGAHVVDFEVALDWHEEPIDEDHPDRYALMRGPAVYVLDAWRHEPLPGAPWPDDDTADGREDRGGVAHAVEQRGGPYEAALRPYFEIPEGWSYRMYFDRSPHAHPIY
ncbi:beta-L-arabinofuranosidase domain-containing protein [Microbacterium sulfonylureivorans]|uniref:beta-L-arabinofuranosidase domain-containing protein n=1 Tax=Microbacterium sulfonylureivorans TaxID=2486854 RepID=UPI000FDB62C2|nr:beta-L-arabinofuranosidase domain-containing protein [Microbacterium sulfonylureivorans]